MIDMPELITLGGIGVTIILAQRATNADLSKTIQGLFNKELQEVKEDNALRDVWIAEVEKRAIENSGHIQVLDSRVASVEKACDRRHEPRTGAVRFGLEG